MKFYLLFLGKRNSSRYNIKYFAIATTKRKRIKKFHHDVHQRYSYSHLLRHQHHKGIYTDVPAKVFLLPGSDKFSILVTIHLGHHNVTTGFYKERLFGANVVCIYSSISLLVQSLAITTEIRSGRNIRRYVFRDPADPHQSINGVFYTHYSIRLSFLHTIIKGNYKISINNLLHDILP